MEVKATNTGTGSVRSVITEANGTYILTNLPIGNYTIEATKKASAKLLNRELFCRSIRIPRSIFHSE